MVNVEQKSEKNTETGIDYEVIRISPKDNLSVIYEIKYKTIGNKIVIL